MFGAPLGSGIGGSYGIPITRTGDILNVRMSDIHDGDGHSGDALNFDRGPGVIDSLRLFRNGRLGAEGDWDAVRFGLPAEPSHYRLEAEQDSRAVTPLGTRTAASWEFDSARTEAGETHVLGLPLIDYDLQLDDRSRLTRRRLTVNVIPQPGLAEVEVRRLRAWYSTDDGATWQKPRRTGRLSNGSVTMKLPRLRAGVVLSLRADTTTTAGVRHTDEIVRAVEVARRADD